MRKTRVTLNEWVGALTENGLIVLLDFGMGGVKVIVSCPGKKKGINDI